MPRIVSTLEFVPGTKDRIWQMMTRVYEQLARVVNGGISFGTGFNLPIPAGATQSVPDRSHSDNIDCVWIEVIVPAANTDFVIHHNLGRVLSAYIIARKSNPVDLYDSPNNVSTITTYIVRATAPAEMVLLLF